MNAGPSPSSIWSLGLLTEEEKDPSYPTVSGTKYVRAKVNDFHHNIVLDKCEGTSFEFKGLKVPNYYD
jgi:hypothetical protein